jgi:hypothetical protein
MAENPENRLCKTHCMLPILLEGNLDLRTDGKDGFLEAIHGQLTDVIGKTEPIFEELFIQLLRKRRVLVLVDSFSELSDVTRQMIRPAQVAFPVAAILVTSRREEWTGTVTKTTIETIRVQGNRLSVFMDSYLKQRGKRDLFEDVEYFDACKKLAGMVGTRAITVLIVKMYADQMIDAKEHGSDELPHHLPELMLRYLNNLNRDAKVDEPDNRRVQHAAKIIAWECLKPIYRPSVTKRSTVVTALKREIQVDNLLRYLEKQLQIIQTIGASEDQIRFSLDPLAEYLAGLYIIEEYGRRESQWRTFCDRAAKQLGAPENIISFLHAVYDCCVEKGNEYCVPSWVKDKLALLCRLETTIATK